MAIIRISKNTRCSRIAPLPVTYSNQKNAWSDTAPFRECFYDVFIPFLRKFTSKKVVPLLDNCEPHGDDIEDSMKQISIWLLHPNCTTLHQPIDTSIIVSWKALHRRELVRYLMAYFESRQERRDSNKPLMNGTKGLVERFEPHIHDVARLVKELGHGIC